MKDIKTKATLLMATASMSSLSTLPTYSNTPSVHIGSGKKTRKAKKKKRSAVKASRKNNRRK